jgi:hypothetical protein
MKTNVFTVTFTSACGTETVVCATRKIADVVAQQFLNDNPDGTPTITKQDIIEFADETMPNREYLLTALRDLLDAAMNHQDFRHRNGAPIFNAHAAIAKYHGEQQS